jgi:hypothetical protein
MSGVLSGSRPKFRRDFYARACRVAPAPDSPLKLWGNSDSISHDIALPRKDIVGLKERKISRSSSATKRLILKIIFSPALARVKEPNGHRATPKRAENVGVGGKGGDLFDLIAIRRVGLESRSWGNSDSGGKNSDVQNVSTSALGWHVRQGDGAGAHIRHP